MAEGTRLVTYAGTEGVAGERSAAAIRQDIAARREVISDTVDRLSERVQRTLDWHEYVAEHPLASVGIAAGLGWLVAGIFKPRPSPRERILDALSETVEDLTDRFREQFNDLPMQRPGPGRTVKAAATAVLAKAVANYVGNQFRGTANSRRHSAWGSETDSRDELQNEAQRFG